jgi:hypothetical protein
MGASVSAADYAKAVQYRQELSTKYLAVLSTVDAFAYPVGNGGAFSISEEAQYGSIADFNAAREKYANSYDPSLGPSVYSYQADSHYGVAQGPSWTCPSANRHDRRRSAPVANGCFKGAGRSRFPHDTNHSALMPSQEAVPLARTATAQSF